MLADVLEIVDEKKESVCEPDSLCLGREVVCARGLDFGLVHATHAGTGSCAVVFLWEIDDEGAHGDGGCCDADGVLDGFASDASWVDNTGFLEVDEAFFWRHDVDALPVFGGFDLGEKCLRVEAGILHDLNKWSLESIL